ncbi:MAG: GNAT family N-acetyltransferase [Eubacteriales bacterium]|nr:GNAT family N-acetyltransferase [Eubacteriales bacterium]
MILRKALENEAKLAYQCIDEARNYQQSLGFIQWHAGYPNMTTIKEDIQKGIGYVFEEDGKILGYCCILLGDEPAYHEIEGTWLTERPYGVVHRMGFNNASRGKGYSAPAFASIKEFCLAQGYTAVRIDTQEENKVMQHILQKEGFVQCGIIFYDNGPRLAYEWDA